MINIDELLEHEESDFLDYKREWHTNKASLVHDILALSNSLAKTNRYLILGIADDGQDGNISKVWTISKIKSTFSLYVMIKEN